MKQDQSGLSSRYSAADVEAAYAQLAQSYRGTHDPNFPMGAVNVLHSAARAAVSERLTPSAEALKYAREFVADPDKRTQVKVQLEVNGWPQLAKMIDEAVVVSRELLRLGERNER